MTADVIVLFTDFGPVGPYVGQVKAVLCRDAPGEPVIDLFADAPAHAPKAAAYLLAAYAGEFPEGTVFLAVVDPGVGGPRLPGVLEADGRWYVGPDNGLFELIVRRAKTTPRWWDILWRPDLLSETFHGRDLFAPIAARLVQGETPLEGSRGSREDYEEALLARIRHLDWPDDLAEIIYLDGFGNAMTGLRAETLSKTAEISVSGRIVRRVQRFSDVAKGDLLGYENANGLLEISVNQGRADTKLDLKIGSQVTVSEM